MTISFWVQEVPRGRKKNMDEVEKLTLTSSDGANFSIKLDVARMSQTIKNLIEDAGTANPIPLPNVSAATLTKVVEYCNYHHEHPSGPAGVSSANGEEEQQQQKHNDQNAVWDAEYVKMEQQALFELILAANYLDIKPLLDLTCKTVANMIKGKTPEEIRKTFNIKNDFTPEEEEQLRKENEWCEEK